MEGENQNQEQNTQQDPMQAAQSEAPVEQTPVLNESGTGEQKKSIGPLIGIIIIVVLLILGGFYFWGTKLNNDRINGLENGQVIEEDLTTEQSAADIAAQPDPALTELEAQSSSDEIDDIEADLETTELDNLDEEFSDIDQELNS